MVSREREDRTINEFCERLQVIEQHCVEVVERPDRDIPGTAGCDAIICRGERRYALEHTTIDSYSDQRVDDHRFREVVVPLEDALHQAYPDSWIQIVVPVHAIPTGTDWPRLGQTLRRECIQSIADLPLGGRGQELYLRDIPFPVWISRERPDGQSGCFVMREAPGGLRQQLESSIGRAIGAKNHQLAPYKQQGLRTILLLDSDDAALVSIPSLSEAFVKAAESKAVQGLDEIFIAQNRRTCIWFFPVKLGERIYPQVEEFNLFRRQQYALTYREGDLSE